MVNSMFFNSKSGDRVYKAEDFAAFFAALVGNGVFPNPSTGLQILAGDGMIITAKTGKAWINGYFFINQSDTAITLDGADGVFSRIDRVVIRWNLTERDISLVVLKGRPAPMPEAEPFIRDADTFDLVLADIRVGGTVIAITQAEITDLRLNRQFCGIVTGLIQQVDTTTLFNQYAEWFRQFTLQSKLDFLTWVDELREILTEIEIGNILNLLQGKQNTIRIAGLLKGDGEGNIIEAEPGVDYVIPGQWGSGPDGPPKELQEFIMENFVLDNNSTFSVADGVLYLNGDLTVQTQPREEPFIVRHTIVGTITCSHMRGDSIAYGTNSGRVYRLNKMSGEITGEIVTGTTSIIDVKLTSDNAVYVLIGRIISKFSFEDGVRIWFQDASSHSVHGSIGVDDDNNVYFIRHNESSTADMLKHDPFGALLWSTNLRSVMVSQDTTQSTTNSIVGLCTLRNGISFMYVDFRSSSQRYTGTIRVGANGVVTTNDTSYTTRTILAGDGILTMNSSTLRLYGSDLIFRRSMSMPNSTTLVGHDTDGNTYQVDSTNRGINRHNPITNNWSPVYSQDVNITNLICGDPGDFYIGAASTIIFYLSNVPHFTRSRFEKKRLLSFDAPIPLEGSVPLRGVPDYEETPHLHEYMLEVQSDGIYVAATNRTHIPGRARIRFSGAILLDIPEAEEEVEDDA